MTVEDDDNGGGYLVRLVVVEKRTEDGDCCRWLIWKVIVEDCQS